MQRTIKAPGLGKVRFVARAGTYMGNANGYKVSASGRWCGKDVKWTRHFMVLSAREALDRAQELWETTL
jgi:hypothetical protein